MMSGAKERLTAPYSPGFFIPPLRIPSFNDIFISFWSYIR